MLLAVFKDIDADGNGKVTLDEVTQWRDRVRNGAASSASPRHSTYVYYNESDDLDVHRYEFRNALQHKRDGYRLIDTMNEHVDHDAKWAVFRPGLSKKMRNKFKVHPSKDQQPFGHWVVLKDDHAENMKAINKKWIREDLLDSTARRMIYELMHHYYMKKLSRSDPDAGCPLRYPAWPCCRCLRPVAGSLDRVRSRDQV